jgi:UPF0755 protein
MFKRFIIAIIFLGVAAFAWYFQSTQPVARFDVPATDFEIKPGTGINQIGSDLSSAKLIRSRAAFKVTIYRLGIANKIQAGFFKLSPNMDAVEIAEALTHASTRQIRVTIPEGLRSEEINFIINKAFDGVKGNQYSSVQFANLTKGMEGRLFPDTYDFALDASASDVVKRLTGRFDEIVSPLNIPENLLPRVVVLASLLEREAASSSEMPLIAGVITKRLDAGWPLQIDATVQYALGSRKCKQIDCEWWKKSLTIEDLRLVSPYNTYLNQGFPPAPIANPGKDALVAAANPEETSAWFYLHDLKGAIHFANTIEEHNQNVCLYLKKDCR